ncbi:restriction endonuclease subunit S [Treponema sp. HNW]|uniref:restriction endonuclease subunit S n=1 Tax=Treponema sp. HNW TaxID=3116654 RepID=UPI003D13EEBC
MRCNTYNLEELVNIKYGKNQKKIFSKTGTVPIYGTGGLIGYGTQYLYNKPSILIGRKGSIEKIRYVEHPFWTVDTLFYTEINTNLVIPLYLYYKILLIDLSKYNEGTTIPSLRTETLNKLQFEIPNIEDQLKIVSIIRPIDLKIENNQQINHNLEEQIKTLCNAWLSEFIPFKGSIPSDWSQIKLSDIADFIGGYSYTSSELTDSNIAMATIKNFERNGGFKLDGYKEIIPSSRIKPIHYIELFDLLVAHTDLTQNAEVIGNAEPVMSKSAYTDIIFSMDLVKVCPKKEISKFLIAALLQTKKFKAHCLGYVNGTTVLHLNKKALSEYTLMFPQNIGILKPLDDILTGLYMQIAQNIAEISTLTALRDTLLPKLMSGEIDVSAVEIGR